jgi:D-glycero-D-manno-heptose 1,7-bisphosphate phosphatase
MRRAVFLDRDGTINRMVYNSEFGLVDSPANPDEFELLPGVGEAIRQINQMGLLAIVVSNQPGVAKGRFNLSLLEATTRKMHLELQQAGAKLEAVFYCLHHPQAISEEYRVTCECRKPKPGLLHKAARDFDIDLGNSYLVGDGVTDLLAGQLAGSRTLFISIHKCYVCDEMSKQAVQPDYVVASLAEAVEVIQKIENGSEQDLSRYLPSCSFVSLPIPPARDSVSA